MSCVVQWAPVSHPPCHTLLQHPPSPWTRVCPGACFACKLLSVLIVYVSRNSPRSNRIPRVALDIQLLVLTLLTQFDTHRFATKAGGGLQSQLLRRRCRPLVSRCTKWSASLIFSVMRRRRLCVSPRGVEGRVSRQVETWELVQLRDWIMRCPGLSLFWVSVVVHVVLIPEGAWNRPHGFIYT